MYHWKMAYSKVTILIKQFLSIFNLDMTESDDIWSSPSVSVLFNKDIAAFCRTA